MRQRRRPGTSCRRAQRWPTETRRGIRTKIPSNQGAKTVASSGPILTAGCHQTRPRSGCTHLPSRSCPTATAANSPATAVRAAATRTGARQLATTTAATRARPIGSRCSGFGCRIGGAIGRRPRSGCSRLRGGGEPAPRALLVPILVRVGRQRHSRFVGPRGATGRQRTRYR